MQLSTNKISSYDFSLQYGCGLSFFLGFSEIWSDTLKLLCNKSHRVTEGTEVRGMLRRWRWHNEGQRCSVQLCDASWDKRFTYKLLIKLANYLGSFTHQRCLRSFHCFVFNNPPFPLFLCVTLRLSPKFRLPPYLSKLLKRNHKGKYHVHCEATVFTSYFFLATYLLYNGLKIGGTGRVLYRSAR